MLQLLRDSSVVLSRCFQIIDINLKGVLYTAQAAGRQMTRFGTPGSIILMASVASLIATKACEPLERIDAVY